MTLSRTEYLHNSTNPQTESCIWRLISRNNTIIKLNEGDKGLPFYCIHALAGDAGSYKELVSALGPNQRIYGIQADKSTLHSDLVGSIELLAQHYVDVLTSFQPDGPFVLGGWSIGAVIAFEMAHQLKALGRVVPLVAVFDGILANVRRGIRIWDPRYCWHLASNLPQWFINDLIEEHHSLSRRIRSKIRAITQISKRKGRTNSYWHKIDTFVNTTGWLPEHVSFARKLYDAGNAYIPKPYEGRVIVYAAKTQPLFRPLQVEAAWGQVCSAIETVRIDGTHSSFLRQPRVLALASDLRARLELLHREPWSTGPGSGRDRRQRLHR
jgi:thioesterase domain-containing protein